MLKYNKTFDFDCNVAVCLGILIDNSALLRQ